MYSGLSGRCSTEWGTRDVSPFDSGVTGRRASEMFRTKLAFIFWIVVVPCGLGAVVSAFAAGRPTCFGVGPSAHLKEGSAVSCPVQNCSSCHRTDVIFARVVLSRR